MSEANNNSDQKEKGAKIWRKRELKSILQPTFAASRLSPNIDRWPAGDQSEGSLLQRQCACGQHTIAGGECHHCRQQRESGFLQRAVVKHEQAPPIKPLSPVDGQSLEPMLQKPHFRGDFSQIPVHTPQANPLNSSISLPSSGAWQYQSLIAKQAGDRSLAGTVQRQPAQANKGLDASMLTVKVTTPPASTGTVTAQQQGEIVTLTAPSILYEAQVDLANSVTLGDENGAIKVGPVQTLVSSTRTGVYKKGNDVVAEMSQNLNMARDARPLQYQDDSSKSTFKAESPFYDRPTVLTDQITSTDVKFEDRPKTAFPKEFGGGRLVAVRGADQFNTSVGAKREGVGVITLNPFGWKVDWTLDLAQDYSIKKDKDGNPIAKEIEIWKETRGIYIDSETYAREMANNTPYIFTFHTVEAAMTESAAMLWAALLPAKQHDPTMAANIEEALRRKNPTFNVTLTVNKTVTWFSDSIGVFAHVTKQTGMQGPFSLDEGESKTIGFPLNDIMDLGGVTSASQFSVWVGGHGSDNDEILGDFLKLPHPFTGSGEISVSGADGEQGQYGIRVSMA